MATIYRCDLCGTTVGNHKDMKYIHSGESVSQIDKTFEVCFRCYREEIGRLNGKKMLCASS